MKRLARAPSRKLIVGGTLLLCALLFFVSCSDNSSLKDSYFTIQQASKSGDAGTLWNSFSVSEQRKLENQARSLKAIFADRAPEDPRGSLDGKEFIMALLKSGASLILSDGVIVQESVGENRGKLIVSLKNKRHVLLFKKIEGKWLLDGNHYNFAGTMVAQELSKR